MIFPSYLEQFKEFVFKNKNKKRLNETKENDDVDNFNISCELNSVRLASKNAIEAKESEINIYECLNENSLASSNNSFARSVTTFKESPKRLNQTNVFKSPIKHQCIASKVSC